MLVVVGYLMKTKSATKLAYLTIKIDRREEILQGIFFRKK